MLAKTRSGVTASSEGYEVADQGMRYLTYRQSDHVMTFLKDCAPWPMRYYLRDVPQWERPHDLEFMSEKQKAQIQSRIVEALRYKGDPFHTDLEGGTA